MRLSRATHRHTPRPSPPYRPRGLGRSQFGESQKLSKAVFTLAHKVQPCIIFIDEIDSFLRERQASDHEAIAMMKAEFMRCAVHTEREREGDS
jgi:hypothetical protein